MRSHKSARLRRASTLLGALAFLFCVAAPIARAQTQSRVPARGGVVNIWSKQPKLVDGDLVVFDGDVDLKYQEHLAPRRSH